MYRIGIDLGGTNIAVGLVAGEGRDAKIVKKISVPTNAERTAEEISAEMAKGCNDLCAAMGLTVNDIEMTGIAAPGTIDGAKGTVVYANNLPFVNFPIVEEVKKGFPCKDIKVDNDANAAALGEAVAGAASGAGTSVMITLGTGVGGGIVIDGKVFSGFNGAGAELGHMVISAGGRPCSCGRCGCWEAYSSATGLIKMTSEKIAEVKKAGKKTVMEEIAAKSGKIDGRTAFDGYRAGDEAATEVVNEYLHYLAIGLGNIINMFRPEVISLGGGVANEKENLIRPLLPLVEKETYGFGIMPLMTEIRPAELGNDAGIIGAAMLK